MHRPAVRRLSHMAAYRQRHVAACRKACDWHLPLWDGASVALLLSSGYEAWHRAGDTLSAYSEPEGRLKHQAVCALYDRALFPLDGCFFQLSNLWGNSWSQCEKEWTVDYSDDELTVMKKIYSYTSLEIYVQHGNNKSIFFACFTCCTISNIEDRSKNLALSHDLI